MYIDEFNENLEKIDRAMTSKINATQKVIRNKFKKAYTNRIEHERDVNRAMNPITLNTNNSESKIKDFSHSNLSKTKISTPQLSMPAKCYLKHTTKAMSMSNKTNSEKQHDVNALCDILRKQLSTRSAGEKDRMHFMDDILVRLRDLGIIV